MPRRTLYKVVVSVGRTLYIVVNERSAGVAVVCGATLEHVWRAAVV